MPNTIMQQAIPEIISNPASDLRKKEILDLMKDNQRALLKGLEGEEYCIFGDSSGALYATVILKL